MIWRFAQPWWLLALIPVVLATVWALRQKRQAAVLYSSVWIPRALPRTFASRVKRFVPWLRPLGLGLVVVALARPQQGLEEFRIRTEGIAILMCLDRSGSMLAEDFHIEGRQVNRLEGVKHVFRNFITGDSEMGGRPDDQVALVAFGGFADSVCPLTLDHDALVALLDGVEVPGPIYDDDDQIVNAQLLNEERATAIGDAVALAVGQLEDARTKSKVIILLSDGEHNAGAVTPEEAAAAAKQFGVKIYAIGIGGVGLAPFPVGTDRFGQTVYEQRQLPLDERTLKQVASTTGGAYFHARDTDTLREVYAEIDALEKTLIEGRVYTQYRELYLGFLFLGIGLVVLEVLLSSTRFRSLP